MKTITIRVAVGAAAVAGMAGWMLARNTSAAPQVSYGQAMCVAQVPSAWGEYKGGSQQSGLAFQANDGTLRFVTNVPCDGVPQVALEIRRTR